MNGKYMRMALIMKLLEEAKEPAKEVRDVTDAVYGKTCHNPKCISVTEQELPQVAKPTEDGLRCIYCEQKV